MLPQSIEDVLNPDFHISPCVDNAELEAWLAFLPGALQRVCSAAVEKKEAREYAEHESEVTSAREFIKLDDGINVTTKKMMAKANDAVIAADKLRIKTAIEYEGAEVVVKGIEAKSQSVRKIATIRANTQQFSETDYVVKRNQRGQNQPPFQQYPLQQPVQQPVQQSPNFGQPSNSFQQPQQTPGWQQPPVQQQQPQGNNSNYYPPNNQQPGQNNY